MRSLLLSAGCFLLVACVTETTTIGGPGSSYQREEPGNTRPEPQEKSDPGEMVSIPPEVMKELIAFVNRKHFVVADRIEVDASRVPFQSAMVPVNDQRYVQTVEMGNVAKNAVGMLIRSKAKHPLVERDFPKLRVGDGMDLVANREIHVRTYNEVNRDRPVFIRIQGIGHAVYRDEASGKRIEKDAIAIRAEVVRGKNGLEFRSKIL